MSQAFRINTNVGALRAYTALGKLNSQSQTAQLRLASQRRINNVADDTSGFNVGKSLDSKVKIMQSSQRNVGSAQDMLATAESQLISIKDMITQIRAKIADASNPTSDSSAIAKDIQSIAVMSLQTEDPVPSFLDLGFLLLIQKSLLQVNGF